MEDLHIHTWLICYKSKTNQNDIFTNYIINKYQSAME